MSKRDHQSRLIAALALAACLVGLVSLAGAATAEETVYAAADGAVLYESAIDSAPQIASLSAGTALVSHGGRGDWVNVDVADSDPKVTGWIKKSDVTSSAP